VGAKKAAPRGAGPPGARGGSVGSVFLLFDFLRRGGVHRLDLGVAELAIVVLVEGLDVEVGGRGEIFADGFEFIAIDLTVGVGVEFFDEIGSGGVGGFLAVALGGVGRGGEDEGTGGEDEEEAFHGGDGFG